jgi:hypothetical protein
MAGKIMLSMYLVKILSAGKEKDKVTQNEN